MHVHTLKRKEDSSQFPFRRVAVSLRCRAISHIKSFWNINQIPFRWDVVFCIKKNKHSRAFAVRLGATHPCPLAVHTEPLSTSVFNGYT
jgi:hypothetical protein